MNERAKMLKRVQMYSFAAHDAALFLDTHPECTQTLEYFNKYNKMYKDAKAEFEAMYGPITVCDSESTARWQWVNDPWPWEESEVK